MLSLHNRDFSYFYIRIYLCFGSKTLSNCGLYRSVEYKEQNQGKCQSLRGPNKVAFIVQVVKFIEPQLELAEKTGK